MSTILRLSGYLAISTFFFCPISYKQVIENGDDKPILGKKLLDVYKKLKILIPIFRMVFIKKESVDSLLIIFIKPLDKDMILTLRVEVIYNISTE